MQQPLPNGICIWQCTRIRELPQTSRRGVYLRIHHPTRSFVHRNTDNAAEVSFDTHNGNDGTHHRMYVLLGDSGRDGNDVQVARCMQLVCTRNSLYPLKQMEPMAQIRAAVDMYRNNKLLSSQPKVQQ